MAATLEEANAKIAALEAEVAALRATQDTQLLGPLLQPSHHRSNDGRADDLKHRSFEMTGDARDQDSWVKMAQNRAHMRGAGFKDSDFTKPIITVAVPYSNALECNNTLLDLARMVASEVEKAVQPEMLLGVCGRPYAQLILNLVLGREELLSMQCVLQYPMATRRAQRACATRSSPATG
jgi:hypothetical protein